MRGLWQQHVQHGGQMLQFVLGDLHLKIAMNESVAQTGELPEPVGLGWRQITFAREELDQSTRRLRTPEPLSEREPSQRLERRPCEQ